jgi:hypothetical protein
LKKSQPPIKEGPACVILLSLVGIVFHLAQNHILNLFILLIGVLTHFFILSKTKFNESSPHPVIHFNRSVEGLLIIALPLATLSYLITYILEGFTEKAAIRADICIVYSILMIFWLIFASISPLGIYFAITEFTYWSPLFLNSIPNFEPPFIIYPMVFLYALMGVGMWFTHITYLLGAIRKKEYYGEQTEQYQKYAPRVIILQTIIGIIFIVFMTQWAELIMKIAY